MNYEEFLAEARERNLRVPPIETASRRRNLPLLSNEALFQLPFLAMVILSISKGRRKPSLPELGQIVGECIEVSLPGFTSSPQHIGWSANLRIRTVKALTFLETSGLVAVNSRARTLTLTEKGRHVIERAMADESFLSQVLTVVERNHRNLIAEAQIRLEV
jgi:hypothetical protein